MKTLIALCLCALSIPLPAQTALRTFTSPDGVFQFKHSNLLVRCTEQRHEQGYPGVVGSRGVLRIVHSRLR